MSAPSGPTRLLGAITPRGDKTWFFKLMGPPAAVEAHTGGFAQFVRSLTFTKQGPKWQLPEGWEAEPGSQMRFATIRLPAEGKSLELTVIALPTGPGDFAPQLLANVNRWRDQVSLKELPADQIGKSPEVQKLEVDGESVWITDFTGSGKGSSMSGSGSGGAPPAQVERPPQKPAGLPFDCEVPGQWVAGQASQFQIAVFDVREGDRKGLVSVSTAGGDLAANINRWRDQVGLSAISPEEIQKTAQKLALGEHEGLYVQLEGPESAQPRKSILGVIANVEGRQWFIKFTGDAELAQQQKPLFESFVKSIRFR
ncbi:MAG: hypothetical protein JSS02_20115 [Planctomycetes bacterium]|nr:hypothetical protein [Planctomycetota bacterium]